MDHTLPPGLTRIWHPCRACVRVARRVARAPAPLAGGSAPGVGGGASVCARGTSRHPPCSLLRGGFRRTGNVRKIYD